MIKHMNKVVFIGPKLGPNRTQLAIESRSQAFLTLAEEMNRLGHPRSPSEWSSCWSGLKQKVNFERIHPPV